MNYIRKLTDEEFSSAFREVIKNHYPKNIYYQHPKNLKKKNLFYSYKFLEDRLIDIISELDATANNPNDQAEVNKQLEANRLSIGIDAIHNIGINIFDFCDMHMRFILINTLWLAFLEKLKEESGFELSDYENLYCLYVMQLDDEELSSLGEKNIKRFKCFK